MLHAITWSKLFSAHSQPGSEDSDSEDDIDYKPEEEWKKVNLPHVIQIIIDIFIYIL